ncbi:MAG: alpha/beta fold hydrolase [Streptosporangiales bacterium]|nr:alpha/beta fold hydrolase [Streptosporangiales bacterium]
MDKTTFVLIPGSDGRAWYWHRVVPELRRRGHETVTVEFPLAGTAGLTEYADAVVEAVGTRTRTRLVVVAQSLGAITGPLVCDRLPVDLLVLLNPMVPAPGETAGDWWENTGQGEAMTARAVRDGRPTEFDLRTDFFHDVPPEVTEEAFAAGTEVAELDAVFAQPWPRESWPDVPTRFLQGRDDRFFPPEFQRRIARERLGMDAIDEMPGGHLLALSEPAELAARLTAYASEVHDSDRPRSASFRPVSR